MKKTSNSANALNAAILPSYPIHTKANRAAAKPTGTQSRNTPPKRERPGSISRSVHTPQGASGSGGFGQATDAN